MREDHGDLGVMGWDQWIFGRIDLGMTLVFSKSGSVNSRC